MNNVTRIVILGTGYSGVHAAKHLNKLYKKNDAVEITLIGKNPYHTLMTELHEVAGGRVEPESVQVSLRKIFSATKVNVVTDVIEKIDFKSQVLYSEEEKYEYDYLLLGSGSEPAFFGVPGVEEHSLTLWSLEDALKIKEHIENMFRRASTERNSEKRKEMLTFVVAGAGFTGIEMVGELVEWKKRLCREYGINKKDVKLMVVEALPKILPILSDKLIAKANRYLKRRDVEVVTDAPIVKATPKTVELKSGQSIHTRTLIWTCGVQGSKFGANLGLTLGSRGRIQTNEFMQSVDYSNVYVIGDNAYFETEPKKAIPQIVETAIQSAHIAVQNISAEIDKKDKKPFKPAYHGLMVSIGSRYAVASVLGSSMSGFFAMAVKHLVNLHYLWGVGGFNLVWAYLVHEFFDIKAKRSIIGGHLSAKSHSIWIAVFRVYVGVLWLLEGLKKLVGENTWNTAKSLRDRSRIGDDSWFRSKNINLPFEWLKAADATGAASEAADGATQAAAASTPTPIMKMPKFFEAIMKILIPNAQVATWFQRFVVSTEIIMGLCLLAGLFTFLISALSAFMVTNFILSGMAAWDILWFFFAAFALMAGAGRALGLDYYVMPWLKRLWSKTRFARRTYLYID